LWISQYYLLRVEQGNDALPCSISLCFSLTHPWEARFGMRRILLGLIVLVPWLATALGCGEDKAVTPTATMQAPKGKPTGKLAPPKSKMPPGR
jgi:hypothetical protein